MEYIAKIMTFDEFRIIRKIQKNINYFGNT